MKIPSCRLMRWRSSCDSKAIRYDKCVFGSPKRIARQGFGRSEQSFWVFALI